MTRCQFFIQSVQFSELTKTLSVINSYIYDNYQDASFITPLIDKLIVFVDYYDRKILDSSNSDETKNIFLNLLSEDTDNLYLYIINIY